MPLGIILVNYKSHNETVQFVEQELSKISEPNVVVVVNNADHGQHGKQLSEALDAQLYESNHLDPIPTKQRIVISEPENLGYARGNNLGFKFIDQHFDTNWVLISNNDLVLPHPNIVQDLIQMGESDSKIGLIGPSVSTPEGRVQSPHRYKSIWTMIILPKLLYPIWAIYRSTGRGREVVSDATSGYYFRIMGCFFLARTSVFRDVEGFDKRTFMYGEEAILSARFRQSGFETYFSAESAVVHHHQQTTSKYLSRVKMNEQTLRSLLIFFRDYDNQPGWVCRLARFSNFVQSTFYRPIIHLARSAIKFFTK